MDPRRGKATRTASKAGAAAPKAQGVKGPPTEPSEPPAALGTARPKAQKCGRVGAPGSGRKKRAPGSPERPPVRARNACAKKAPLGAEDAVEGLAVPAGKLAPPAAPGPPLPRTGSRRERGARAPLEQRTLPEPTEVSGLGLGLGPLVPASRLRKKGAAPGAWKPRTVLEKLKLRRQEISVAAEIVNRVVDHLQRRLQSCESEFQGVSRLCTGSYYERVKVSCPAPLLPPTPSPPSPACPIVPTPAGCAVPHFPSKVTQTLVPLWPVTQFQPKRRTAVRLPICTSSERTANQHWCQLLSRHYCWEIPMYGFIHASRLYGVSVTGLYLVCPSQIPTWIIRSAKNYTKLV